MEEKTVSLSPGDHIFIQRSIHYSHHGIYVDADKVIHYQTPMEKGYPDPSSCRVIESDLETFQDQDQDQNLYVYRYGISEDKAKLYPKGTYTSKQCDAPEVVVERAKKGIIEGFSHYNIVGNNCEDFATYCKTGQRSMESAQFSAALECVAAARRAVAQGYRTPMVYAGCVLGIFTARDFKFPPKNYVPSAPEVSDEDDNTQSDSNNNKRNVDKNEGIIDDNVDENIDGTARVKIGNFPAQSESAKKAIVTCVAPSKTVTFDVPAPARSGS